MATLRLAPSGVCWCGFACWEWILSLSSVTRVGPRQCGDMRKGTYFMTRTRSSLLSGRMLGAIMAACALAALTLAGVARAEPNTWGPVSPLPTGSAAGSEQILSSPTGGLLRYSLQNGVASVAAFESGIPGTATALPGSGSEAELGQVAFLPDGSAVMAFAPYVSDHQDLVVRLPNGQFGPVFEGSFDDPIVAFAGRAGEVLIVRQTNGKSPHYRPSIEATSLSIAANGTLTEAGPPTLLYEVPPPPGPEYGVHFGQTAVALDADGQADVVTYSESVEYADEVVDVSRDAGGTWGTPRSLSAGLTEAQHAGQLQVVVAPGGRALLEFQTDKFPPCCNQGGADETADYVYASLREPGGTFSAPSQLDSVEGMGGASSLDKIAVGGDGTLAVAVGTSSCQNFEDASEVPSQAIDVLVAPPGKPLSSHAISVLDTAASGSRLSALGAGDGQALVGVLDSTTTSGTDTNYCASITINETPVGTVDDRGVLVGGSGSTGKTFGSGPLSFTTAHSTEGDSLGVYTAGIDLAGDAVATGSLDTSKGAEYDYYNGPPAVETGEHEKSGEMKGGGSNSGGSGGTSGGTTGTSGTTGASTGTTTSGTSTSSGASTTTLTTAGSTVTVGGAAVTLPAQASCASAPASPCTVTSTATIPAGGATAASSKHKHSKPVTVGKGTMTLDAGATGALHLTLSSQGLALLHSRHTLTITVTVTIAGQGRSTTTHILHFQLKLKQPTKKQAKTKHH